MIALRDLPAVNAVLNGTAAILLIWGRVLVAQHRIERHKQVMIAAFCVSIAFLICYVIYHSRVGSVHYQHTGPIRAVYFTILITHTLLAAAVPFLAVITLQRGLAGRFRAHEKIARWTFPIWLYVSVTGVTVYLMLYRL